MLHVEWSLRALTLVMVNHLVIFDLLLVILLLHTLSYKYLRSAKDLYIKYCSFGFQSSSDTVLDVLESEVASPPTETKNAVL